MKMSRHPIAIEALILLLFGWVDEGVGEGG